MWDSLVGDLSCTLFIAKSSETKNNGGSKLYCGNCNNSFELHFNSNINKSCSAVPECESCFEANIIRKNVVVEKLSGIFLWAGRHSLEIYVLHGLYLVIVKMANIPEFMTCQGYFIVFINYFLTVIMTCCTVIFLCQNRVVNLVLFWKE